MGEPVITHTKIDFENKIDDYWGIQKNGMIFYADPGIEVDETLHSRVSGDYTLRD